MRLHVVLFLSSWCACPDHVNRMSSNFKSPESPGGGELLPYKRLTGMCHWMGSHFHDWIEYNGVAFSIELLAWGRTFSDFRGKTVFHSYG